MFESLGDKLGGVFDKLRGRATLSEDIVNEAMREIRIALLEADVALPVVKQFIGQIKEEAVGAEVIKSVKPAQQVIKIVNDAMVDLLGGTDGETELVIDAKPPVVYLMVGLQGSGKTTSSAKIGRLLQTKFKKKVLMASLDVQRPAAQEQLETLGQQTDVATLEIIKGQKPKDITKRAIDTAKKEGYDLLILDTAGRLSIDEELMKEVEEISKLSSPTETLLVADAMTGQDAVNTAKAFNDRLGITGTVLTRMDGDARGGAAMSMKAVTGRPVKLVGTGEKWDEIEQFHPDRVVSRILGMGDIVSMVEKAAETIDQEDAMKMAEKFKKGKFDLDDFASQLKQMRNMGGMGAMLKMLPGMGGLKKMLDQANVDESVLVQQEAILSSMTKQERAEPKVLNASRRKRIAAGSGRSVQEVNKLLKQFDGMQRMMKQLKKGGMGGMMNAMKGMMGDQGMDQLMKAAGADTDKLQKELGDAGLDLPAGAGDNGSSLGSNPFAPGGDLSGAMGGGDASMDDLLSMPGLQGLKQGMSKSRFTKKRGSKRKKKK
ncbi:MAG: signal recognition particle protein [Micavibrio sp.]|nr:signal recognition particle protein [Micavibrio sp.]